MTICQNSAHYPQLDLPAEYDARLHNYDTGTPCAPKKYRTIVVDPPWEYRQKFADPGKVATFWTKRATPGRGAAANYGCMTQAELLALPVGDWADDSAHLYLWVTNQFMVEGHELARAWGFEVKTILTWVKQRMQMGFYYRNKTEHVLFGARKLKTLRRDVPTVFFGRTSGRHSEKPAAFYDMVESMSPGPYLDVFARKHRFNWDVYGNEVYSDIPLVNA